MLKKPHFVIAELAQRGYRYREHREAVIEIRAKTPGTYFLTQTAVGRGNDPRVGDPALRFADALIFAIFQHAQQFGLQLERQLADFIEKQRALVRILEVTGARGAGAGERALHVTKKRWLNQRRGNGGAIECEIGLPCPRALPVQRLRDELLAAAGFAFNQHRKRGRRILRDLLMQLRYRKASADDAGIRFGR